MATSRPRPEIEKEMKDTVGLVPSFFRRIPDEFLDFEWELFKRLELGGTLIPNKYKELIGLGVSELSVAPARLDEVRAAVRAGTLLRAIELAETALTLDSDEAVLALLDAEPTSPSGSSVGAGGSLEPDDRV